jgi:hypothetical protein
MPTNRIALMIMALQVSCYSRRQTTIISLSNLLHYGPRGIMITFVSLFSFTFQAVELHVVITLYLLYPTLKWVSSTSGPAISITSYNWDLSVNTGSSSLIYRVLAQVSSFVVHRVVSSKRLKQHHLRGLP